MLHWKSRPFDTLMRFRVDLLLKLARSINSILTDSDRRQADSSTGCECNSLDTNWSYSACVDKPQLARTLEPWNCETRARACRSENDRARSRCWRARARALFNASILSPQWLCERRGREFRSYGVQFVNNILIQKPRRYPAGAGDDAHVGAVAEGFRLAAPDGFRAVFTRAPHIAW